MRRERWSCPGCNRLFSVPDASELVLCPACSKVEPEIARVRPKKREKPKWEPSDIAFVAVGSTFLVGVLLLCGSFLWKAAPKLDPAKASAEQWLRDNLDDGTWDEVKWYPAVQMDSLYAFNRLHIIEGIERAKASYEKGRGKAEHKAECKKIYDMFCETGPRTFCAMKFRVSTLNGQAKALRQQVFEIVDDKAIGLPGNNIRELAISLSDGSLNPTPTVYDGWKLFDDKEYDPFPEMLLRNLDSRLEVAMDWKEPVPVSQPTPIVQPRPQVVARTPPSDFAFNVPPQNQKPKEDPTATIPVKIREYLNRVAEGKATEIGRLDKRLSTFISRRKSAKGLTEIRAIDDRIKQAEDAIAELKRLKLRANSAPLLTKPDIGDMGIFQVVEVLQVVDENTLIVRWLPNGKGQLPKVDVAVHPIDTNEIKVGTTSLSADFVKVTATTVDPSEVLERMVDDGIKVDFIVEPANKKEVDVWCDQYEKENKTKK